MFNKPNSAIHNRKFSYRKALRRQRIAEYLMRSYRLDVPCYNNLHQYSKNKINYFWKSPKNCKTNNKKYKHGRGKCSPFYNPSKRDKSRLLSMDQDEREFFDFS